MKRYLVSFIVTLLLYSLLFFLLTHQKEFQVSKKLTKLSNIRIIQPTPKEAPPKSHLIKKRAEKRELKQIKKPSLKPIKKSSIQKKVNKQIKRAIHKPIKKRATQKRVQKKIVKKVTKISPPKTRMKKFHKKEQNSSLPSLQTLFAKKTPQSKPSLSPSLAKLYSKDEYSSFTKKQQQFLKNNLSKIADITQKYLYLRGYPYIAVKTRSQGVNIIQFILHPNGDITDLKLLKSSGYEALDTNSIETIKIAYKEYPLPKEPTKIRIFVNYKIIY